MLQKLTYEDAISSEWSTAFERLMKHVGQELAPRRNRYVHDYWSVDDGSLHILSRRARVGKSQSRVMTALTYDEGQQVPINAVDQLSAEIGQAAFMVHAANRDIVNWRGSRTRVEMPLLCRAFDLPNVPDILQLLKPEPRHQP